MACMIISNLGEPMNAKETENKLRYTGGDRKHSRPQYLAWREANNLPVRCDNETCRFYSTPLEWNGGDLPLILDHLNGVNSDDRPENLRLLCTNCDSQNVLTKGGMNRGRVKKASGGFAIIDKTSGITHYTLPAEGGSYRISGGTASLTVSKADERPEDDESGPQA